MDGTLIARLPFPVRLVSSLGTLALVALGVPGCDDSAPPVPLTEMTVNIVVVDVEGVPTIVSIASNTGNTPVEARGCGTYVGLIIQAEDGTVVGSGNPCIATDCAPLETTVMPGMSLTGSRPVPTEIWIDCVETQPIDPGTFTVSGRISYIPGGEEWGPENVRQATGSTTYYWAGN